MSRDAQIIIIASVVAGVIAVFVLMLFAGAARWSKPVRQEYLEVIELDAEPTERLTAAEQPRYNARMRRPYVGGPEDPDATGPMRMWEADYRSNGRYDDPTRVET